MSSVSIIEVVTNFPTSPNIGDLVIKNGMQHRFVKTSVGSSTAANTQSYKQHQINIAYDWIVTHNLGTLDVGLAAFDIYNQPLNIIGCAFDNENQIVVTFDNPASGYIVVVPNTPTENNQTFDSITVGGTVVANSQGLFVGGVKVDPSAGGGSSVDTAITTPGTGYLYKDSGGQFSYSTPPIPADTPVISTVTIPTPADTVEIDRFSAAGITAVKFLTTAKSAALNIKSSEFIAVTDGAVISTSNPTNAIIGMSPVVYDLILDATGDFVLLATTNEPDVTITIHKIVM